MSAGEGGLYDAPNQEVVRPDGSPPWEEGEGGSEVLPGPSGEADDLDAMTKDELLALADERGVEVPASATKAEIREAIEAAG